MIENIQYLPDDYLIGVAIQSQHMAAMDYVYGQGFNQHDPARAVWQKFAADASARAREALFELIERKSR